MEELPSSVLFRLSVLETQEEKAYHIDISTNLGESSAGYNPVFPLMAIQLHGKHGMYQGLRKWKTCMDIQDHFKR